MKYQKAKCKIRIVKIRGKPYEMGKQRGEQVGDIIQKRVERNLSIWPKNKALEAADSFEEAITRRFPELWEELRGIADGAKITWENFKAATFSNHLPVEVKHGHYGASVECSSFAASGEATADKMPILAKNGDLHPPRSQSEDLVLIFADPSDGFKYVALSSYPEWPGGPEGMNEKGLALGGSGVLISDAVEAYKKGKSVGVPIYFTQAVMYTRCEKVEDTIEYLKMTPRGYIGRDLHVIDKSGYLIKAEVSFENLNIEYPEAHASYSSNWFFAGTSHFASRKMNHLCSQPENYLSSYKRYDRYMELLTMYTGKIDFEVAKSIMRDHANGPSDLSICRHGPGYTQESVIMQPALSRMWVLKGYPCENEYECFTL